MNRLKNIQTSPLPGVGTSKFVLSSLDNYQHQTTASSLSLKMVLDGTENYRFNHHTFSVKTAQYLIVNKDEALVTEVNTTTETKGVCIYPPIDLVEEAYQTLNSSTDQLMDGYVGHHEELRFTSKINQLESSETGEFLTQMLPFYLNDQSNNISDNLLDFYVNLATVMVKDQLMINKALLRLTPARKTTQEELYRRLSVARDYLNDHKTERVQIDTLAQLTCLSKYHFLRSFKALYGQTPYQYLLQLKLDLATQYLNRFSLPEICERIGFSDPKNLKRALKKRSYPKT